MPLAPEQDIVSVVAVAGGPIQAVALLKKKIATYKNDMKVVSISMVHQPNPFAGGSLGVQLVAVLETAE